MLAIVNTVASVFSYLRWLVPIFREGGEDVPRAPWAAAVAYGCAAGAVLLGVAGGALLPVLSDPPTS